MGMKSEKTRERVDDLEKQKNPLFGFKKPYNGIINAYDTLNLCNIYLYFKLYVMSIGLSFFGLTDRHIFIKPTD